MSKVLKLGVLALLLFVGISFTKNVKAYDWNWNDNVQSLLICGVDYNDKDETQKVQGIEWDHQNTITVKNCNCLLDCDNSDEYFIWYHGDIPMNIVFEGTNNVDYIQVEDGYNHGTFISTSTNADINISGTGTINLKHCNDFVSYAIDDEEQSCDLTISGVTVNADGTNIYSKYGNLTLNNTNLNFKKINEDTSSVRVGSNNSDIDGNGTISINNSNLELVNLFDGFFQCKNLVTNGYIYGGTGTAQYAFNTTNLFKQYSSSYGSVLKESLDGVTYLLFTNNKQNYPDYSTNKSNPNAVPANNSVSSSKPGKASIKSLKNKKGKKAVLTWGKVANAKKYTVMYAMKKNFKGAKKKTVSGTKVTIKKLKKKKTYFFKVRGVNGSQVGAWSAVKKIKIKK